ncbi:alpha-amylase family glycosyl hydrolase [Promethearchaeum syntrophicum]|uniref:Alpha-amylase family glycosyl hydrolase n=1 Tax=Promethearchaeum syntrophicum TaxID=2594042 RepID=A0A5B9D699_9ARCH|nr:alpha-amylase family glycosyl hydrolase [Candidatus Prometheoarchaeum syntrophicum]QEE14360.1 cytoplasmic alpha-amylase [Candidatus Prometheoarchaeum syntrophicum]
MKNKTSPRIYNLFPRLLGSIDNWDLHLKRIIKMGFNWIFVNPVNYTGFSGSLYSIKNYFRLNPMFALNKKDEISWGSLKTFITKIHANGLKFMIDIVFNHTAIDSPLISEHPSWFKKKWVIIEKSSGNKIKFFERAEKPSKKEYPTEEYEIKWQIANPYAINPENANDIQIWGDLAEIDYDSPDVDSILAYWKKLFDFYDLLGIDGFRVDAAYQVPSTIWKNLLSYVKNKNSNAIFYAETLGATLEQYDELSEADFDYIACSSKWWDYTAPWCLEQYNKYRKFAPSISFPENHDTIRVAFDTDGREDIQEFKYFFASFFSAGVEMPIGYEFGFKTRINVVNSTPEDYEEPRFDISDFILSVNKFKQRYRCLNEDGEMIQYEYPDSGILLLKKCSIDKNQQILLIYNKDWRNSHHLEIPDLEKYLEFTTSIFQIELNGKIKEIKDFHLNRDLNPIQFLIYIQSKEE